MRSNWRYYVLWSNTCKVVHFEKVRLKRKQTNLFAFLPDFGYSWWNSYLHWFGHLAWKKGSQLKLLRKFVGQNLLCISVAWQKNFSQDYRWIRLTTNCLYYFALPLYTQYHFRNTAMTNIKCSKGYVNITSSENLKQCIWFFF